MSQMGRSGPEPSYSVVAYRDAYKAFCPVGSLLRRWRCRLENVQRESAWERRWDKASKVLRQCSRIEEAIS